MLDVGVGQRAPIEVGLVLEPPAIARPGRPGRRRPGVAVERRPVGGRPDVGRWGLLGGHGASSFNPDSCLDRRTNSPPRATRAMTAATAGMIHTRAATPLVGGRSRMVGPYRLDQGGLDLGVALPGPHVGPDLVADGHRRRGEPSRPPTRPGSSGSGSRASKAAARWARSSAADRRRPRRRPGRAAARTTSRSGQPGQGPAAAAGRPGRRPVEDRRRLSHRRSGPRPASRSSWEVVTGPVNAATTVPPGIDQEGGRAASSTP